MAFEFTAESEARLVEALAEYHDPMAALLPALYIAQDQFGYITPEVCALVARRLDLDRMHVESVASFYTMYHTHPVGRYHIQVCRTLSCAMAGGERLLDHLVRHLEIEPGQVTPDGKFSIEAVECLALCGSAPVMLINKTPYENLTEAKVDAILASLE